VLNIAVCVPACAQGQSGNPFFDCVTMNSGVPPFKSFVQANGNNAKTLANHFVSYLKGTPPQGNLSLPLPSLEPIISHNTTWPLPFMLHTLCGTGKLLLARTKPS